MRRRHPVLRWRGSLPETVVRIWYHRERGSWAKEDDLNIVEMSQGTRRPRILKMPEILRTQELKVSPSGKRKTIQFSLGSTKEEAAAPGNQEVSGPCSKTSTLQGRARAPGMALVTHAEAKRTREALKAALRGPAAPPPPTPKMDPDPVSVQVSWDPRGFWTMDTSTKLKPQEPEIYPTRVVSSPPPSYFRLVNDFLKPEKPAKTAGLIKKTVEAMTFDHQVRETKNQQKMVADEAAFFLNEKLPVQAGTTAMLANLTTKAKEYRKEIENQWRSYAQEGGKVLPTKQEFAQRYTKHASELLGKEKMEYSLKQQLEAVRAMRQAREKQQKELQALQEKLKKAQANTAAKAQARYLEEKAFLEKQLHGPAMDMLEKSEENTLKWKVQALEEAAERRASEWHRLQKEEKESHQELKQQPQHSRVEKTVHSWLKLTKQQTQQHWTVKQRIPERQELHPVAPRLPQIVVEPPQVAPGLPQIVVEPPQVAPGPPHAAPRTRRRSSSSATESTQSH